MTIARYLSEGETWRTSVQQAIDGLTRVLTDAGLLARESVRLKLSEAQAAVAGEQLRVAFLAEFSRGKTELINALFFAGYQQRVLPSRTGRTTMTPTELEWFAGAAPEVLLLPIAAARDLTLREARLRPELWVRRPFDPADPEAVLAAANGVSEMQIVTADEAEALGFRIDPTGEKGLEPLPDGTVRIPAWRHAIIRYPHPLLESGLVVVDTPGLNTIGAEIDLTLSLLPECHAVVFVLGIDTGVTRSDLAIWRRFVQTAGMTATALVVLNKIDALEDGLRSQAEIQAEIAARVEEVAHHLGISPAQVFPVSAQRALVGRIRQESALVAQSRITTFEKALAEVLVDRRLSVIDAHLQTTLAALMPATGIEQRLAELEAQWAELDAMRGKSRTQLLYLLKKIQSEREELDALHKRAKAAKNLFARDARALLEAIGRRRIREEVEAAVAALQAAKTPGQMREAVAAFFDRVHAWLEQGEAQLKALRQQVAKTYQLFATEHGVQCAAPADPPSYEAFVGDLDRVRQAALEQVSGWLTLMTKGKRALIESFVSLVGREIEARWERQYRQYLAWVRVVMVPLDSALAERAEALEKRAVGLQRIHDSIDQLEPQIAELEREKAKTLAVKTRLEEAIARVRAAHQSKLKEEVE